MYLEFAAVQAQTQAQAQAQTQAQPAAAHSSLCATKQKVTQQKLLG